MSFVTVLSATLFFLLMCSCSINKSNDDLYSLSYVDKENNSQSDSTDSLVASDISDALSFLNLTPSDVSDSTDAALSEKMMKDYISYIESKETFYSLGKCDSRESDILQNGYAFVTSDQIKNDYIGHFYYAIPEKSALYECNVNSELFICWKNNLPVNEDKATKFIESVVGEDIYLENVLSDGFYAFSHNDRILYVNWECNRISVSTDNGEKAQIYPTDTIGYFK